MAELATSNASASESSESSPSFTYWHVWTDAAQTRPSLFIADQLAALMFNCSFRRSESEAEERPRYDAVV